MGKITVQNLVLKIPSSRLVRKRWNLVLPLNEARRNDEVVALASSQMLRWIDELNGNTGREEKIISLKKQLKAVKKLPNSHENRMKVHRIYEELDRLQFKPDYVIVVFDRMSHLKRAAKGFTINGQKFVRLVATNGQVKVGAATFISERLAPEILKRVNNGRNEEVPLVPAKLEAYRALTCSSSTPVTKPRIAVVDDCETAFKEDALFLDHGENGRPTMEFVENADLTLTESDGYGLVSPEMAKKWSEDLELDYVPGGFNTRMAFEKGMVFPFDFVRFADTIAHTRIITDVWGDKVDVSDVDVILTASQLKLHGSYDNCAHYMKCCDENNYEFAITKVAPDLDQLDLVRATNYQFIQPYELSDEDIDELIRPTVQSIKNIISDNSRYATLFLHGTKFKDGDFETMADDFAKALLIDARMQHDPYVMKRIQRLIKNKINDLSVGVIDVEGNFTIIGGDPFSLMQNTFGLEVTGLLKPHEIYSSFWRRKNVNEVVCFRAPMSTAENIVKMHVSDSPEAADWFQYINSVTLLSSFSGECHSLNGADKQLSPALVTAQCKSGEPGIPGCAA